MLQNNKVIVGITIPLSLVLLAESITGFLLPSLYTAETLNWAVQTHSQDFIDLVIVLPVLLLSCTYTVKNKAFGLYASAGIYLYLSYTFTIYTFALHFNSLFLCYCITFGLSVYGFLYILYHLLINSQGLTVQAKSHLFTAWYFIGISVFFSLLWLGEIIPALWHHRLPASLMLTGLPVNPVQALDLSLLLPLVFITGLWIKQGKTIGHALAPVVAVFFVLMSLTIAIIALFMSATDNLPVIFMMVLMAFASAILFLQSIGTIQRKFSV